MEYIRIRLLFPLLYLSICGCKGPIWFCNILLLKVSEPFDYRSSVIELNLMDPKIPTMVLPVIIWSFQVLNRESYLWQPEAPKKVLWSTFFLTVWLGSVVWKATINTLKGAIFLALLSTNMLCHNKTQWRCELTPNAQRAHLNYLTVGSFWVHSAHSEVTRWAHTLKKRFV